MNPIFFYYSPSTGRLYHRDTQEQRWEMEKIAQAFEAEANTGRWPSFNLEMAQQARNALAEYDADPNHVEDVTVG